MQQGLKCHIWRWAAPPNHYIALVVKLSDHNFWVDLPLSPPNPIRDNNE